LTIKSWQVFHFVNTGRVKLLKNGIVEKAQSMTEMEKNCIMFFDEISVSPKLEYNEKLDKIIGK
jgi:hypothetical protein